MVDRKTAFRHDLLQMAIGERLPQIPANAEQDRVFEVPPAEQCWPFSDQTPYQIRSARLQHNPIVGSKFVLAGPGIFHVPLR
jgi:hypothetical protein